MNFLFVYCLVLMPLYYFHNIIPLYVCDVNLSGAEVVSIAKLCEAAPSAGAHFEFHACVLELVA